MSRFSAEDRTPLTFILSSPSILPIPTSLAGLCSICPTDVADQREQRRSSITPRYTCSPTKLNTPHNPTGYLAIQLVGLSVGTLILPPSPSFFRRRQAALTPQTHKRRSSDAADAAPDLSAPRQTGKMATELCAYAAMWWGLLGLARITRVDGRWSAGEGVSRRIVRAPPSLVRVQQ